MSILYRCSATFLNEKMPEAPRLAATKHFIKAMRKLCRKGQAEADESSRGQTPRWERSLVLGSRALTYLFFSEPEWVSKIRKLTEDSQTKASNFAARRNQGLVAARGIETFRPKPQRPHCPCPSLAFLSFLRSSWRRGCRDWAGKLR